MGALTDIMERVFQILETKVGTPQSGQSALVLIAPAFPQTILIKTSRFYPLEIDTSKLPHLSATFGEATFTVNYGRDGDEYTVSSVQGFTVWAFLNRMKSGASQPKETLDIAEPLVDALKACFFARTRLQLERDSDKLDCLTKDVVFQGHSGMTVDNNNVGIISFNFQIEYDESITRI